MLNISTWWNDTLFNTEASLIQFLFSCIILTGGSSWLNLHGILEIYNFSWISLNYRQPRCQQILIQWN
jgi:hypothetical protein